MGGSSEAAVASLWILAVASVLTFGPALFRVGREYWGVVVLFCGAGRALVALGIGYLVGVQNPSFAPRALFLGIAAAALLLLVVETVVTINILSRIERRREALKGSAAPAPSPQA
ncbi:MAG TPA: hypothetical protein VFF65_12760 [Phycisphaerales bacterium]|nr:hypothetical protein [Phycisphaerales bacterium]